MRARLAEPLLLLVVLVVLAAAGGASAGSTRGTVHAAVSKTLGTKILVSSRGFTLYHSTSEKKGSVSCTGSCRKTWPPLLVTLGKPVAGTGLTAAKLSTIKRPDGGVQVTYYGYSLYLYSGDKKAGQVNGQGVDGWYALTPTGSVTKVAPKSSSETPTKTSSGGNPSASGSSGSSAGSGTATGTTAVDSIGCPPGQIIAQGAETGSNNSDDDQDNDGGGDDGDGCM